jgi:choline-sulfatase
MRHRAALLLGLIIVAFLSGRVRAQSLMHTIRFRPDRVNIVLILTDQQTFDAMSNAGNHDLHTPVMDRLAANGVRFTRAYCAQPLCTPSRSSMMSGRMPFETGFVGNAPEKDGQWPAALPTMGKIFHDAGYKTGYVGKWHLPIPTSKTSQHGFDYIQNTDFQDFNDGATPSFCARFIKQNVDDPFLLVASFLNPHDICEWARGEPLKMDTLPPAPPPDQCPELPTNWAIPAFEPPIVREQQKVSPRTYPTVNWGPGQWRQYRWAYFRLVEKVDANIGQVIAALEKYDVAKDTVIVFTADHGDGDASHHWNQKQVLYEESARVPLIVARLGKWKPRTDDALVCNGIDMIPTLCGFAGIRPTFNYKGQDLSRRIADPAVPSRDALIVETDFADNETLLNISGRAVITKDFKYIVYSKGEPREQLTELATDPGERFNQAVNPAYKAKLGELRSMLREWCRENGDHFEQLVPARD